MTANHYLSKHLTDHHDDQWCLISCSETSISEHIGSLSTLAAQLGKSPVIALIDSTETRVLRATVPGRSESQVKQAAPYVVEEDLAGDVDELSIHVSKVQSDGTRLLTVYELEELQQFCQPLKAGGIRISALFPAASMIAAGPHQLIAVLANERVLFAHSGGQFATVDHDVFAALANRLIRDENITEALIVLSADFNKAAGANYHEQLGERLRDGNPDIEIKLENSDDSALKYIVSRSVFGTTYAFAPNLLPQSTEQNTPIGISRRTSYLLAAGLAVVALLGHIGFLWSTNQSAARELTELTDQKQQIFAEAFPEIKRIVNPEAQAQQRLSELKKQGPPPAEFLAILRASTAFFEQHKSQDLKLTGFSFADGVLLLRTESKDMALLEKYRSELSGFLSAEVVNAESGGDVISGAIRVKTN